MVAGARERQSRRANSLGAVSLRLVVALGASTGLTAAVALPMALQAHQARQADERATLREPRADVEVLGTSTVPTTSDAPTSTVPSDGLYLVDHDQPSESAPLDGTSTEGRVHIEVRLPELSRVDVRVGSAAVTTIDAAPWVYPASGPLDTAQLGPGEHVALATITFADGRNELRRATLRVPAG